MTLKTTALAAISACFVASASAETFRQALISSSQNINVSGFEVTSKEATPDCPVAWSISKRTLHGGKQEGVEIIVLDNGKLQMTIVPTRGMGIHSVRMGDVRLGWDSPVTEIVHPKFINLQMRGGLGWLEGFNEWMCRCGMESNGHPGTDKFINNVGDEATMDLTLHGRVANLPAQEVEVVVDRESPYRIRIRGRVDERMFYGPKLELQSELSTEPGSSSFRISDVITNVGPSEQEFQMMYHCNYGRSLLEEGAEFVAPIDRVSPFNANAAKGIGAFRQYGAPTLGFIEQVYCIRPLADKEGRTLVMLQNKAKDRAIAVSYSVKELPYLTQWKNTAAEKDGYVTGIEPATNFARNRRLERKAGRVPKLAAGASYPMSIDFTILTSAGEIQRTAERIAEIQGGRKMVVDQEPERLE